MSGDLGLVGEVGWVSEDHLGLGLKLELVGAVLHGSLDTGSLIAVEEQLIHVSVEHVSAAVDGGQTGETLRQFSKTVERVDVRRLSVSGNRVTVQADALDGLRSLSGVGDVVVGEVQSHGVANKVLGAGLKTELVVDVLHGTRVDVKAYLLVRMCTCC